MLTLASINFYFSFWRLVKMPPKKFAKNDFIKYIYICDFEYNGSFCLTNINNIASNLWNNNGANGPQYWSRFFVKIVPYVDGSI